MTLIIRKTGFEDYFERSGGEYIKALILGQPDVGKTRSASFWPKALIADCEKGLMSVADRGVGAAQITSSADMKALVAKMRAQGRNPNREFDTLVIDTIDSLQRIWMQERLREERKDQFGGWADWGWLEARSQGFLADLLSLPMHIVVNSHVKMHEIGDDEDRSMIYGIKLKGDLREQIPADFDLIGMMENRWEAEKGKRVRRRHIRWHSDPLYPMLKDRSGRLPETTEVDFTEADFTRIRDAVIPAEVRAMAHRETVAEVETGVVEPAPADVAGGPVGVDTTNPLPSSAKKPAKKAAPKKTAAKKATPRPAEVVEAPASKEPDKEAGNDEVTHDEGVAEVQQQMGATVVEETTEPKSAGEPDGTAEASTSEPSKKVKKCGDRPPNAPGEGVKGCGRELVSEADRRTANIASVRHKTFLCPDCVQTVTK